MSAEAWKLPFLSFREQLLAILKPSFLSRTNACDAALKSRFSPTAPRAENSGPQPITGFSFRGTLDVEDLARVANPARSGNLFPTIAVFAVIDQERPNKQDTQVIFVDT